MKKVLIVEDDEKLAKALSLRVRDAGYEPSVAYDGVSGVISAARNRPDAVLLDINLPAGNGFSVARRLQAIMPERKPIIFITASRKPDLFYRAIDLGAAGFVEKPYDPEQLIELLHNVMDTPGEVEARARHLGPDSEDGGTRLPLN